jgi:hypothetical protein
MHPRMTHLHCLAREAHAPLFASARARAFVNASVRLPNRLTRPLKPSGPQGLQGFQDTETPMVCACLSPWPTLTAAPRARRSPPATCFRHHYGRAADVVAQRRHAIQAAHPLTTDEGVSAPQAGLVQALGNPLRVTWEAMATFDHASAPRAQSHPDCPLVQALPGAGPVFASRLRVAFGEQRARSGSAAARPT